MFVVPALVLLAAFTIYPIVNLFQMALTEVGAANLMSDWGWVGLANFGPVLTGPEFWQSLRVTVVFSLLILVVNLVLGFVFANLLAVRSLDAVFTQGLMIFVWALPSVVNGNIWRFLFAPDGAVNRGLGLVGIDPVNWLGDPFLALVTLSFIACWASLPFSVMIYRAALLAIPNEVFDAGAVDGASVWQIRLRIVIPLLRPTILILAILNLMYGFRSFEYVYVVTSGGPGDATTTLPYLAYREAFQKFDFSAGAVVAILGMLAVALLGLAYLRAIRREEAL